MIGETQNASVAYGEWQKFTFTVASTFIVNYAYTKVDVELVNLLDMYRGYVVIDEVKIYYTKPFSKFGNDGLLVYSNPNQYIQLTTSGLTIKGGTIEASNLQVKNSLEVFGDVSVFGDFYASSIPPYDSTPEPISTSGDDGTVSSYARGDHSHALNINNFLSSQNGITVTDDTDGTATIGLSYGSAANTAVQGNTQITITAGDKLSGGGTITLGAGGAVTLNHNVAGASSITANNGVTVINGLTIDSDGHITATSTIDADSRFVNVAGDTITGDLTVGGNLTVNGTQFITNTETVEIEDNLLVINNGETGAGVTLGTAGIEVDRGTLINYQFMFRESDDSYVIGQIGSLQAVATREDTPISTAIPY